MASLSPEVDRLLAGAPPLPLTQAKLNPSPRTAIPRLADSLFPNAAQPQAALAGLLIRFGHWSDSHQIAQDISSVEGSYWHAILHRLEPDPSNAAYWFRRVGPHPIFPELHRRAEQILCEYSGTNWKLRSRWDPFLFIEWCEAATQRGGEWDAAASAIQLAEWQLLFEWCVKPSA